MSSENVCPTVPCLYRWDSGTSDTERDKTRDKDGTKSLKALALASLAVPPDRDKLGQDAGQASKSCPTATDPPGTKKELVPPPSEELSPATLDHARRMLVVCPVQGRTLHCWYCSRCDDAPMCTAWRIRRADVEFFRNSDKPYSLFLVESMEVAEVLQ